MAHTLSLEKLYTDVRALYVAEATPGTHAFGWRTPFEQLPASTRIDWVPGDETGRLGDIGPPKWPGRNPRPIGSLDELFHVCITGFDATGPTDEFKQWKATRLRFDEFFRALYLVAYGTVTVLEARWETSKNAHRFGATLIVTCGIQSMLADTTVETAPVDVKALITTTELDQTDSAVEILPVSES